MHKSISLARFGNPVHPPKKCMAATKMTLKMKVMMIKENLLGLWRADADTGKTSPDFKTTSGQRQGRS